MNAEESANSFNKLTWYCKLIRKSLVTELVTVAFQKTFRILAMLHGMPYESLTVVTIIIILEKLTSETFDEKQKIIISSKFRLDWIYRNEIILTISCLRLRLKFTLCVGGPGRTIRHHRSYSFCLTRHACTSAWIYGEKTQTHLP